MRVSNVHALSVLFFRIKIIAKSSNLISIRVSGMPKQPLGRVQRKHTLSALVTLVDGAAKVCNPPFGSNDMIGP